MRDDARSYYRELGREYPVRIRQLVPGYDDMAEVLVRLLAREVTAGRDDRDDPPPRVLDLGVGEGTLAARVLAELPEALLTGVDASGSMLDTARRRLAEHGDRVTLVEADLADFEPARPVAAAYSSLTLHNLSDTAKRTLLERVRGALTPGGSVVWADLIRHADPALQEHFTERRIEVARERGCPEDFIAWNFEKESTTDAPLTLDGARELARDAGYRRASPVWLRGVFGALLLRA